MIVPDVPMLTAHPGGARKANGAGFSFTAGQCCSALRPVVLALPGWGGRRTTARKPLPCGREDFPHGFPHAALGRQVSTRFTDP